MKLAVCPSTRAASKVGVMLPLAAKTAAQEGLDVIRAMLVVGLIFLGVIVLGELTHWLRHRRH